MTQETCGTCRFWHDKHAVEAGHKLGECCFNPPQLVMGQSQAPSAIQRGGMMGMNVQVQQMGLSPPALSNRAACHEYRERVVENAPLVPKRAVPLVAPLFDE